MKAHLGLKYTHHEFGKTECWQLLNSRGYAIADFVIRDGKLNDLESVDSIHPETVKEFVNHCLATTETKP